MNRFYGHVEFADPIWRITAEPHILLRIKRVFERIHKNQAGCVELFHSPENCRDLAWFMQRYPLRIETGVKSILLSGEKQHHDDIQRLETIIDPNYTPRRFELALPPRDYQARGAEIYLNKPDGGLIVGDDLGLGKTALAICSLVDPRTLPTLIVAYPHLQSQWRDELSKFAPKLDVHITKTKKPYELPKFMGRGPDVLITTYTKLSGWQDVAAAYVKSAIFDECQELRRDGTDKYCAAKIVGAVCRFRLGLTATPIYNQGGEFFNIVEVISPGSLGRKDEFEREWCA